VVDQVVDLPLSVALAATEVVVALLPLVGHPTQMKVTLVVLETFTMVEVAAAEEVRVVRVEPTQ